MVLLARWVRRVKLVRRQVGKREGEEKLDKLTSDDAEKSRGRDER